MGKVYLTIDTDEREYTAREAAEHTMTVKELTDFLSDYNDDTIIILRNDKGYTYGAINEHNIEERSL